MIYQDFALGIPSLTEKILYLYLPLSQLMT